MLTKYKDKRTAAGAAVLFGVHIEVISCTKKDLHCGLHSSGTKRVSARDMSLSIGQNAGYINTIESGKAFPSMTVFFYICEYLDTKHQLKTIQKIEHNLAYMDYAMIFCL